LFPHHHKKPQSGFTLLEILIVIVIIAVLSGMAVIGLTGLGSGDEAETTARRIAALLRLGSDEAVLSATEMGLYFEEDRYAFLVFSGDAWLPLQNDKIFRPRQLPTVLDIDLIQHGEPLMLAAAQAAEEEAEEEQEGDSETDENSESQDADEEESEEPAHPPPQILILSGGGFSPFELIVETTDDDEITWVVKGGLAGEITVERKE
ncbi:MAG TPA: type II secretion system minor pseudopilin GspH, partial [Gammaproteobacteria bacterium]|nr:type II secretion system minor pseudopilin GspH [Gammaproteobacteria bacterium]